MTVRYLMSCAAILTICAMCPAAQETKKKPIKNAPGSVKQAADQLSRSRADVIQATQEYKTSLNKLISVYQPELNLLNERVEKLKGLYSQGLVSRVELEKVERELTDMNAKLAGTRKQLTECDDLVAEVEAAEKLERVPRNTPSTNSALIRYEGSGKWMISEVSKLQSFYTSRFGDALPVSAYGQSSVHDRMGFDHRDAIDVAVHPDSKEGASLMQYLRSAGIPFLAFRHAVPGSATGAHIHIGRPSQRIK